MKLRLLHENFIQHHTRTMLGNTDRPVIRVQQPQTPLIVADRWEQVGSCYRKKFLFRTLEQRNRFVVEMMFLEVREGHSPRFTIENKTVWIELGDEILNITATDRKVAKFADALFRDVTYNHPLNGRESYEREVEEFDRDLVSDDEF